MDEKTDKQIIVSQIDGQEKGTLVQTTDRQTQGKKEKRQIVSLKDRQIKDRQIDRLNIESKEYLGFIAFPQVKSNSKYHKIYNVLCKI